MTRPVAVSFVVDDHPKFRLQSVNLIGTLLGTGTVPAGDVFVHLVGGHPAVYREFLAAVRVNVVPVRPYGAPESPYCNKLVQLRSKALAGAGCVALLDADVAFAADLSAVLPGSGVRAKTVDTPSPPLPLLRALLHQAGLPRDPALAAADFVPGETLRGNMNGGVCLFDRQAFGQVGPHWLKWTHFTLANARLLGPFAKHADQVGLALALVELGLDPTLLGPHMNFPTHLRPATYRPGHDLDPSIIHYHDRLDDAGLLVPPGLPRVDAAVSRVNALLRPFHAAHLPPALLADWRESRR
ncbi:hypothetical protein DVDV_2160 [Desulfovibrio sp. DV]|uniref:hypothetical protein n=1 Tax=Desulfovibrio sp. DV TaxID=1844708 RepID=UPI00094BB586|nr:hypothetical protein [Desulfovibrio sp. DV]OLN27362.1 hypothetical protein DVDV_2160 [Desulfovibrio sp. DV]